MFNEKKIKSLIIISLLVIEFFVWTVNNPNIPWSFSPDGSGSDPIGIIGGADGPPDIINDGKDGPDDIIGSNDGPATDPGGQAGDGQNGQIDGEEPGQNEEGQSVPHDLAGYPPAYDEVREQAILDAEERDLLILVNKTNPIDRDYEPEDLTEVRYFAPDRSENTRYLRAEAAAAFHRLVEEAAEAGHEYKMTTAYRSYDFQKILFDSYVAREGEEKANTYSAKPGQSEHQTGLSVDVSSPIVDYQLSNDFSNTEEGKWLADNAHRYGFIIRFPKGKEDITGYQYEPWHLRYVGQAVAQEIYEYSLTLEEFLIFNGIE